MKLSNRQCWVEIQAQAAQINHFVLKKNNFEYIWQGDPKYWSGRNPILFPIVGHTYSGHYRIDGKTYTMGNHGLARHAEFKVKEHSRNKAVLEFTSDEKTKEQYPFDFSLKVKFELQETKLAMEYIVTNKSKVPMPFSFGLHPAFNCPLDPNERFSDYYLELEKKEVLNRFDLATGKFIKDPKETKVLKLKRKQLAETIILKDQTSEYVRLTNGKQFVEVQSKNYPYLAFWSKPQAPFVCLEPWQGHSDFQTNRTPFAKREGTIVLEPGKHYRFRNYILIG